MKNIFESTWVYLAHESQIPRPHDFFTTYIGRQPVIVNRDKDGNVGGFINACPHRGATVCRAQRGNQAVFVCPYHGWSFSSSGQSINIKDRAVGGYHDAFDQQDHGLARIPKLAAYRGFIFGSLNPDGPDLEEHLGGTRVFIDLMADQSPEGLEVLKGSSTYTHRGNWKMQTENGNDGYHLIPVHASYLKLLERRAQLRRDVVAGISGGDLAQESGTYDFGNGHTLLWAAAPRPQDRPLYERRQELAARVGELRADWMIGKIRNLLIYPNVFFMDQTSTQIRVIRPLAVDRTEVRIYCIAPVGESPRARERRIRQYEDFFNASGLATPDDLAEFEACHEGFQGRLVRWQPGYDRGMKRITFGPDAHARALGFTPATSSPRFDDEVLYHGQYRQWLKLMSRKTAPRGEAWHG
jgi:benzoate/toluate 1,2-dioxygenase alpha subunit